MDVEERLQRGEAELAMLLPLRRLAVPAAPDLIEECGRTSMLLIRLSAVAGTVCAAGMPGDLARRWVTAMASQPPGDDLGALTDQMMDVPMLARGKTAGSA